MEELSGFKSVDVATKFVNAESCGGDRLLSESIAILI